VSKRKSRNEPAERMALWKTVGQRIAWLLDTKFMGNRSEMGRAAGVSHSVISRVVSGKKLPGRHLLTAFFW
jgi:hypothetical protein